MMNNRQVLFKKFRLIFIPFLLTTLGFLIIYTFLHWLLLIKLRLFAVKDDYVDFGIPFILAFIAVLTWLKRRIKLLQLKKGTKDRTDFIQVIAGFAMAVPLIIAQLYLETASGSMTPLSQIEDITKKPNTKFYSITSFYVDTANKGIAYISELSGRFNQELNLNIYICCPIYDVDRQPTKITGIESGADMESKKHHQGVLYLLDNYKIDSVRLSHFPTDSIAEFKVLTGEKARSVFGEDGMDGVVMVRTKKAERNHYGQLITSNLPPPKAWCCIRYSEQISNNKSNDKKKEEFHWFYKQCMIRFQNTNLQNISYLERTGYNDDLAGFKKAIRNTPMADDSALQIILEPKFTSYADRNGNKLAWIFYSLGIGSAIWFGLLLIYPFDEKRLNGFLAGKPVKDPDDMKEMIRFLKPRPGYYFTPIVVDLNLLIFLIMVITGMGFISFNSHDLLNWGANNGPSITRGEWWRLITSIFLHSGIIHLVSNMIALLFVGGMLESKLGTTRITICYMIAGICSSLTSLQWHGAQVGVGASGAIFGLYGIFLTLMLTRVYSRDFSKIFLFIMVAFIGVNLLIGLNPGFDNAAHIGGLLSGVLMGFVITLSLRSKLNEEEA